MATNIGNEESNIVMLEHLIALDYDAIMAYDAAIARLDDPALRAELADFRGDHERHIKELRPIVKHLGGDPPERADSHGILAKGRVVLANLAGDEAILKAMISNEDDTNLAYERAMARTDVPEYVQELLARNQGDERRHRAWLQSTLRARDNR